MKNSYRDILIVFNNKSQQEGFNIYLVLRY